LSSVHPFPFPWLDAPQFEHGIKDYLPDRAAVFVALGAKLVTTLRGHYRGIVGAVAFHEDGGSAPDVDVGATLCDELVGWRSFRSQSGLHSPGGTISTTCDSTGRSIKKSYLPLGVVNEGALEPGV
jgi:hypothetical protein